MRFGVIKNPLPQGPWGYDGCKRDAIGFTTNKAVDLVGVRMFGSNGSTYEVQLKIYKGDEIVLQLSSSFVTESEMIDDLYYGFTVNLDKPVRLDPGVVYTVAAQIDGPMSYSGGSGIPTITVHDLTITYKSLLKSNNCTSVECGQFPTLVLRTAY